jgi:NAD(P)-dependent dehydrogenase (short-subunit alcohol dehydrogenase family)
MAKWMSSKGARNIVLVSRSASVNDKVQELMDELAVDGTHISVKACDVSSRGSVEKLVKEDMRGLPPVRGVVHGAMVLRVRSLSNTRTLYKRCPILTFSPRISSSRR